MPVLSHKRLHDRLFLFDVRDLAGFDFVLRDPACLGRVTGNEGGEPLWI